MDMFGVFWLKKRAFHYRIKTTSEPRSEDDSGLRTEGKNDP
jgi:hypothetical protein